MSSSDQRYEILELLGAGGMGQVYRAHDSELGRDVALKILRGDDPRLLERAQREARHQARIDHENVGHVYDVGERDGKPFVAMQLVEGRTLGIAAGEMSLREKVEVMRQVAEGVQAAHSRGLVHRDLKPGNVLVERRQESWHPWVVDFGLALDPEQPGMTATGAMVGTAAYMSPEQIRGERSQLDRRSDVYSLGATFFELLTGRAPFVGDNPVQVLMHALRDEAPTLRSLSSELPLELEYIVAKCLEKDADRRYSSARLLAEDLERFLRGEPVLAQAPSLVYRIQKTVLRHRALAIVAVIAALLVVTAMVVALRTRWQAVETARLAEELGREAEQVATRMHMAQLAPRHDLAPEKQALRQRIALLEEKSSQLGSLARGPGLVAAGRASLSLGDLPAAREYLEKAKSLQSGDQELSRALGTTLGRLYRQRLESIRRLDARWRDLEIAREEKALLVPALDEFRLVSDFSQRDQAFVALLEGDLERAEIAAREAVALDPWNHRIRLLLADVLGERAQTAFESGESDATLVSLNDAREVLREARSIGRSDPDVDRRECALAELRFEVELLGSLPAGDDLEGFLEPCDLAVATDSGSAENLSRRAGLRRHFAARAMRRGLDPLDHLAAAIGDGEAALELDPELLDALYQTGVSFSLRANHAAGSEEEIASDLQRAGGLLDRCVARAPGFIPCRVSLGVNRLEVGIALANEGQDSRAAFLSSIEAFEEAIELAPDLAVLHNNLGYTRIYLSEVLLAKGEDPRPRLERARSSLRRAVELAPEYASARYCLGEAGRVQSVYLRARGKDPALAVAAAEEEYAVALDLDSNRFWAAFYRMKVHLLAADYLLDKRLEAGESLAKARTALQQAMAIEGEPLGCEEAEVLIREARSKAFLGESPEDALRRAIDLAEDGECPLIRARSWSVLAEWQTSKGVDPLASARGAVAAIEVYLEEVPEDGEAWALRAELELLRARVAETNELARLAAQQSVSFWEKALEAFPVAAPLWSDKISETRRIAGID